MKTRSTLFLASALLSAGAALLAALLIPNELAVKTDIVGYPIHRNFNVDHYFHLYYLVVLFFPLLTMGLYAAGSRFFFGKPPQKTGPLTSAIESPGESPGPRGGEESGSVAGISRLLLMGAALGAEAVVALYPTTAMAWAPLAAIPAAYSMVVILIARVVTKRPPSDREIWTRVSAINVQVAPLTVMGLYVVSIASEVSLPDGSFRPVMWMPLWLIMMLAALSILVIVQLRRKWDWLTAERKLLTYLVAPLLLFVLIAQVPRDRGRIDFFHEGEKLTAASLVMDGWFPWRDFMPVHGIFEDVFSSGLGLTLFEDSRWGAEVGRLLILAPLYWIAAYFLLVRLFQTNRIFLAGAAAMLFAGQTIFGRFDYVFHPRFTLIPLVLVSLVALLRRATILRAAVFICLLGVQVIITPETAFLLPALGVVLVGFEFVNRRPDRRLSHNFRRTYLCLVPGAGLSVLWIGFLWMNDAVDDFAYYFLTFAPGHRFTGGIPYKGENLLFHGAAVLPLVLIVASVWYFSFALRRRTLSVEDWVMTGLAVFLFFYYRKFLSRADAHVFQPWAISLLLLVYVVYKIVEKAEERFRNLPSLGAISLGLVLALLIPGYEGVFKRLGTLPERFRPSVPELSKVRRIGYSAAAKDERAMLDLQQVLNEMLEPGDGVFDFSNAPAIHYFLDLKPVTRYYHVSMAIRKKTQDDLLRDLRKRRPKVVIFDEGERGLPGWDGIPNTVRHYEISRYLLDEYEPVLDLGAYVFYVRRGTDPRIELLPPALLSRGVTDKKELYFHTLPCNWGFAPNFLEQKPGSRRGESDRLQLKASILTPPPGTKWEDYDWIEIDGDLRPGNFALAAETEPRAGRSITFRIDDKPPRKFLVQVGSCPQWHGFGSDPLYLWSSTVQDLRSVTVHK